MCVQESSLVFPRIDKGRRTMWLVGPQGSWGNARRTVGGVGAAVLGAHGAWDHWERAVNGSEQSLMAGKQC
jgi:hypothetical protein